MTRTVIALYDDFADANDAVRDLTNEGIPPEDISIVAGDERGDFAEYLKSGEVQRSAATEGAGVGAGIGAVIGGLAGLLVGLGVLTIPGIGPVIAAGPLAAALSGLAGAGAGAVAGGTTGGLLGVLVDVGVPRETAGYYQEAVRRGGTMVAVQVADDVADAVVDVLNRYNPVEINQRAAEWREQGWSGHGMHETREKRSQSPTEAPSEEESSTEAENFTVFKPAFREHYEENFSESKYSYTQYLPAYRYGYNLATDDRYGKFEDWEEIEADARHYWNERNPGTWEDFKAAVHFAWSKVKEASKENEAA